MTCQVFNRDFLWKHFTGVHFFNEFSLPYSYLSLIHRVQLACDRCEGRMARTSGFFICCLTGSWGWWTGSWPWWPPPGWSPSTPTGPRTPWPPISWAASRWTAGKCRGWRSCSDWPAAWGWWRWHLETQEGMSDSRTCAIVLFFQIWSLWMERTSLWL